MDGLCTLFVASPLNFTKHHNFKIRASKLSPQSQSKKHTRKEHRKNGDFPGRDAFLSLKSIHSRNPYAIYKDLKRFAEQNKLKQALAILDYMDKGGIPVDPNTFSALIAAVVRKKSLSAGKLIHTHIRINGLENNDVLRTKLVHMYTSCGSIEDAQKLFDGMPSSSVYPWNALLRGNVIMGGWRYQEVLKTFSLMRELGIELNVYTFSCLIKSLGEAPALYQGLKTHGLLIKNGFISDSIVSTSLIDMYFKCGKPRLAHRVFEELGDDQIDIVVWGAMISGFAHNRLHLEAFDFLRLMVKEGIYPNSVILTRILPMIGEVSSRKHGQEVHAYVIKTKQYSKQLSIQSGLIDMYCKCGDMGLGRKVFYGSMERNTISWTALMSGYVANGMLEQALKTIIWMQQEGFKPDVVAIVTVIPVCGKLRTLKQGKEIHCYAVKNRFFPHISLTTSLMMLYSKCGYLDYSCKLFDGMERRNIISWTAMMESHIEGGCLNEALGVFRAMVLSKHRPDTVTASRMLRVCGELKALKLGKEIHGQVLKRDFLSVPFVSSEIVKMYGLSGEINKAWMAFETIPVKGSMTWTAIIEAYGYSNCFQEAIDLFNQMTTRRFSPNQFTFKTVLSICERAGFADEACRIFRLMNSRYKVEASEEHYSSIIRLLTSLGRTQEAERFSRLRSSWQQNL